MRTSMWRSSRRSRHLQRDLAEAEDDNLSVRRLAGRVGQRLVDGLGHEDR